MLFVSVEHHEIHFRNILVIHIVYGVSATAADAYHFYDRGVVVGDKSGIVLEIRYVGIVIFHSGKNG